MKRSLLTFSLAIILNASSSFAFVESNDNFTFGNTLVDAVNQNNSDIVKAILLQGTDPNQSGKFETSALHRAAFNNNTDITNLLIQNGADLNIRDYGGTTPLHIAARGGKDNVAKILVTKGADINAIDDQGYSPLHRAIANRQNSVSMFLLGSGADVNTINNEGNTPLIDATRNSDPELVKELLIKGADRKVKNNKGLDVIDFALKVRNWKIDNILGKTSQELMNNGTVSASTITAAGNTNNNLPSFLKQEAQLAGAKNTILDNEIAAIKVPTTSVEVENLAPPAPENKITIEENIQPITLADLQFTGNQQPEAQPAPRLPNDGQLPASLQQKIKEEEKKEKEEIKKAEINKAYQESLKNIKPIELPKDISEIENSSDSVQLSNNSPATNQVIYNFDYQEPAAAPTPEIIPEPAPAPVPVKYEEKPAPAPSVPASMKNIIPATVPIIVPVIPANDLSTQPVQSIQVISQYPENPLKPDTQYESEVNSLMNEYVKNVDVSNEYETEVDSLMSQLVEREDVSAEFSYPRSLMIKEELTRKYGTTYTAQPIYTETKAIVKQNTDKKTNDYDNYKNDLLQNIDEFYNKDISKETSPYNINQLNEPKIQDIGLTSEEQKKDIIVPPSISGTSEELFNDLPTPVETVETTAVERIEDINPKNISATEQKFNIVIGEFPYSSEAIEYMNKKAPGTANKLEYKIAKAENSNMYSITIGAIATEEEAQELCNTLSEGDKVCEVNK